MRERLQLGAPGIYVAPEEPVRALTGVRMDVAAFVGVAPRGPARLPAFAAWWAEAPRGVAAPGASLRSVAVPVESWDAYRRLFGGFEGPGLLPYAVAAFFEQGGRRAYVVRVVHDYGEGDPANDHAVAKGTVTGAVPRSGGGLVLRARSEGSWGNRLRATLAFRARPLAFDAAGSAPGRLALLADAELPVGSLLRLWLPGGVPVLRFVTGVWEDWRADRPERVRYAGLEYPADVEPERVETVEAELTVLDAADDGVERVEIHSGLGLSPLHPCWMARMLWRDSALVYPDAAWIGNALDLPDPDLRAPAEPPRPQFTCGRDRYPELVPEDFFDAEWTPGDEQARGGIHALVELEDLSVVVVPDLYSPGPLVPRVRVEDAPTLAGPRFAPCVEIDSRPPPGPAAGECDGGFPALDDGSAGELDGLRLDPALPGDRETVVGLQARVVELAELLASWQVLLDVPPGLNHRQVLEWRSRFASAWAAGYHPWLRVSRPDDLRDPLVPVPPSAFAAGIVARQEVAFGVPHGPANVVAVGPVSALDAVSPARHAELHQAGVNVFLGERDGIRLTAGRTLSRDPRWRQLSVRRLVTLLRRTLLRQMQWTVFEPNDARLRDELQRMLEGYLERLFRADAFSGRTAEEAFFVRCDDALNPPAVVDGGRLVCHVGVAPAEPLEFILLRLSREGDGTLLTEE
ncbi:MAG: phage tail sheath C-terminal domain-containing protein [Gemmatimonadota bacterium]